MARRGTTQQASPSPWDWCDDARGPDESDRHHIILWHGCLGRDAAAIMRHGVDPTHGRPDADFGRGFYLTTLKRQAVNWAWERNWNLSPADQARLGSHPAVLRFRIPRIDLARLEALHFFIRPDHDNEDYWSLVHHFRKSSRAKLRNHKCTNSDDAVRDN